MPEICKAGTKLGEKGMSQNESNIFFYKPLNIINCINCFFPFMREKSQLLNGLAFSDSSERSPLNYKVVMLVNVHKEGTFVRSL